MTTNAGAEALSKSNFGFTQTKEVEMRMVRSKKSSHQNSEIDWMQQSHFLLDNEIILKVVDKFLIQLETQLHDKKVDASFTKDLKNYLAKSGFDEQMGARPMARLIQDTIRKALADELLFGKLVNGGEVEIDIDDKEKIVLNIKENEKASV